MHYLTVATCIKQEDDYIDDFIAFNKAVGVEHHIFFDRDGNNLTNKFKDRKDITVVKFPEPYTHQYSHEYAVKQFQGFSKWIAFIDCDQALFSPIHKDVRVVLQEFEKYAQLQPCWETFGNSFLEKKENGSVFERFTKRANSNAEINNHTQGIADISKVEPRTPHDPHRLMVKHGELSVDENHNVLQIGGTNEGTPHVNPHTQNKIFIPHYYTKSKEEWIKKNLKGRADIPGVKIPFEMYDSVNSFANEVDDFRLKDFWDKNVSKN